MLKLHGTAPAFGVRNPSPYCLKAETLLKLSGVPYEKVADQPMNGPRKKVPFLERGDEVIADSANIAKMLIDEGKLDLPEGPCDALVLRTIEEHLAFFAVHFRFTYSPDELKAAYFAEVPAMLRSFVFNKVHKSVKSNLFAQGAGRRPEEEMLRLARADFAALTRLLDDKPFFAGTRPGVADASAHGLFTQFLSDLSDPLSDLFQEHEALVRYHSRVERFVYGEVASANKEAA